MATRRYLRLQVQRGLRRERVFRDRTNPFDLFDDIDFYERYRFDKASVHYLMETFCPDLTNATQRSQPVPPPIQMCIALRYLASNSQEQVIGDTVGLHKSTVCCSLWRIVRLISFRLDDFIKFPEGAELERIQTAFQETIGFPGVCGLIAVFQNFLHEKKALLLCERWQLSPFLSHFNYERFFFTNSTIISAINEQNRKIRDHLSTLGIPLIREGKICFVQLTLGIPNRSLILGITYCV